MIVYDADGKEYLIEETDLKGGESKLYTVEKHPELRAKIFKEEYRTRGREAKILEWLFLKNVCIFRKTIRNLRDLQGV